MDTHIECTICGDDVASGVDGIIINSAAVCKPCLTAVVQRVISGEDPYPAKINNSLFDVGAYGFVYGAALIRAYKEKSREEEAFPAERVYCNCGAFVGKIVKPHNNTPLYAFKICEQHGCHKAYCMICKAPISEYPGQLKLVSHGCESNIARAQQDYDAMANSSERGVQFQICPTCKRPVQLRDACNHITCHCGESFCYICGNPAGEMSGHWGADRCPRYGLLGRLRVEPIDVHPVQFAHQHDPLGMRPDPNVTMHNAPGHMELAEQAAPQHEEELPNLQPAPVHGQHFAPPVVIVAQPFPIAQQQEVMIPQGRPVHGLNRLRQVFRINVINRRLVDQNRVEIGAQQEVQIDLLEEDEDEARERMARLNMG